MNKTIYTELTVDHLKVLLDHTYKKKSNIDIILIKFTAAWCKPCQKIKELCNELFQQTSNSTICFNIDIDIDTNVELYRAFKAKKMIRGVPTIFGFNCNKKRDMDHWYIPDESVCGSDEKNIKDFFFSLKDLKV